MIPVRIEIVHVISQNESVSDAIDLRDSFFDFVCIIVVDVISGSAP